MLDPFDLIEVFMIGLTTPEKPTHIRTVTPATYIFPR
jgi:hypothetical protein